ncbi:hybrid-cluster NAD(P)-dependent oxidoreductase [Aeromonas sp. YN13HZO-058]|uniref:hybrid-cluster NAD(P)-dependent oxidoreductase n=1 Tax=Aeromonas sp. YN13HZO-058 TaxID=1921564 RepID=UPI000946E27F|nr:hybrid-cluster NAD(P)-dependent oxidoreductase [Aeromonas sp. YN13HZO-058]OLF22651.1 hybrid-cluster NAD(P)-dependent oxidoreductase [Aeromonas sp. YN13HZO-058]
MTSLTLTCIGRQQNTHDVVSWQLVPLSGSLPPVLAGQCITLHTEIDGQPECRAYTLSSSPQDSCWQVTIKDVGLVSRHLHQTLQVGDKIQADGPFGEFNLTNLPCERPLLLSAGSGITPMWAMLRDELAKRPDADIRFIHSARSPADVIFAEELTVLAEAHIGLRHAFVLEQAPADHPWVGRLTPTMLAELAPDLHERHVYLCGPTPYMAAISTMLAELGLPPEQLHQESFGLPTAEPAATTNDHFWLTLKKSGKKVKILPGQTLLAALEMAGETMMAACRAGVCGSCRCSTEGNIERQSVMTLNAQDLANGVALACSCTAKGDISLDY